MTLILDVGIAPIPKEIKERIILEREQDIMKCN